MIYHDVMQNSPEWFKMRQGLATTSCFGKIITPTGQRKKDGSILSASADDYANQLIGELVTGENSETFKSYWMERGAQMEDEASRSYMMITDNELDRGGFITDDDFTVGASPDRRIIKLGTAIGGVEIKCPSPTTQVENLLRGKSIDPAYKPQVQGQILIGGFEYVDWFSYHPDFPPAFIRTYRDDVFCELLTEALEEFENLFQRKVTELKTIGAVINPRPIINLTESRNSTKSNDDFSFMGG